VEESKDCGCVWGAELARKSLPRRRRPSDPDLLTVKALRLIQSADVILHDDLVPQPILDLAAPSAEIVNVGKRCGTKSITQEEIQR